MLTIKLRYTQAVYVWADSVIQLCWQSSYSILRLFMCGQIRSYSCVDNQVYSGCFMCVQMLHVQWVWICIKPLTTVQLHSNAPKPCGCLIHTLWYMSQAKELSSWKGHNSTMCSFCLYHYSPSFLLESGTHTHHNSPKYDYWNKYHSTYSSSNGSNKPKASPTVQGSGGARSWPFTVSLGC